MSSPRRAAIPVSPTARRLGLTFASFVACAVAPVPLAGQGAAPPASSAARGTLTLVGVVRDPAGVPLLGAEVRVDGGRAALSDERGRFTLPGVPFDTALALVARRIGYAPAEVVVQPTQPGLRIELAVTLVPTPLELGTIVVEGERRDKLLWDRGFYERQKLGSGRFYGPEFFARFGGAGVATLVTEEPGLHIQRSTGEEFAFARTPGGGCRMHVFVDGRFAMEGLPSGRNPGIGLNTLVGVADLHGVEIYPSLATVPMQFQRRDAACGAIVIWTKPFAARTGMRAADGRP